MYTVSTMLVQPLILPITYVINNKKLQIERKLKEFWLSKYNFIIMYEMGTWVPHG